MSELKIQLLDEGLAPPRYSHESDAGLDLRSRVSATIGPRGGRVLLATGISVELPPGHVGLVCPRSGLAAEDGVTVLNAPGIVDAGYRGEVAVVLVNFDGSKPFAVTRGDRIAQLVVVPVLSLPIRLVDRLGTSDRLTKGFGHSGRA
jgi:dUTP pyrophosphatase